MSDSEKLQQRRAEVMKLLRRRMVTMQVFQALRRSKPTMHERWVDYCKRHMQAHVKVMFKVHRMFPNL